MATSQLKDFHRVRMLPHFPEKVGCFRSGSQVCIGPSRQFVRRRDISDVGGRPEVTVFEGQTSAFDHYQHSVGIIALGEALRAI